MDGITILGICVIALFFGAVIFTCCFADRNKPKRTPEQNGFVYIDSAKRVMMEYYGWPESGADDLIKRVVTQYKRDIGNEIVF